MRFLPKYPPRWLTPMRVAIMVTLLLLAVSVGMDLLRSQLVYGNYKCAFAHCIIVRDAPGLGNEG